MDYKSLNKEVCCLFLNVLFFFSFNSKVKMLMEEAVIRGYVHEDSETIGKLCCKSLHVFSSIRYYLMN